MALLLKAGPALKRLPDWPGRMSALVRARRQMPYEYGVNDCATFAVDSVIAVTGVDLAPGVERPKSNVAGGRFLIANGVRTIEQLFLSILGESWGRTRQARRGDLVCFAAADETHMALVTGREAVTPGPDGLLPVPADLWVRAWKIG